MKRRGGGTRREREGGFALLLVFLMAAVIAITLYMEVPRLAFDTQRQKEQLLIERGQQYQIAIRRYMQRGLKQGVNVVVGPAWPAKIEDLEDTNGRRFLRKRYIDPMTGKDEWRLVHINNGILTDSINNKQKNTKDSPSAPAGISEFAGLGQTPTGAPGASLAATRRRPSDSAGSSGGGSDPNLSADSGNPAGTMAPPAGPAGQGGNTSGLILPGNIGFPGQPQQGSGQFSGSSGFGDNSSSGSAGSSPNPAAPQIPGVPGLPANSNYPGGVSPFFPQPGGTTGQLSPASLINNLLTQPRPTGMPQVVATGNAGNATAIGGGIAGIASNLDADSIMVCGDHSNYQEWEFIFDPSKWRAPADPRKTVTGTQAGSQNPVPSSSGSPSVIPQTGTPTGTTTSGPGGSSQQPGGSQGTFGSTCGMEARPGIQ
jgi:hypothetical protein